MTSPEVSVTVHTADSTDAMHEAASIWAYAKARRDQSSAPAAVEEALPGIRQRLSLDGANLLLARRDADAVGFALIAPRAQGLEVFYVAIHPDEWGLGVATQLLLSVDDHARRTGRNTLELWVIDDNERAISVYERAGWVDTGEVLRQPTGRLERRLLRHLR